jgi:hypothetical protein
MKDFGCHDDGMSTLKSSFQIIGLELVVLGMTHTRGEDLG